MRSVNFENIFNPLLCSGEGRFGSGQVSLAVLLFDGDLFIDNLDLFLLDISQFFFFGNFCRFDSDNFDQFVGVLIFLLELDFLRG